MSVRDVLRHDPPARLFVFDLIRSTVNGVEPTRTVEPVNGPLMLEHSNVRLGRPTSVADLFFAARGMPSYPNARYVPADRDFNTPMTSASLWEQVEVAVLHREHLSTLRWRGRPSAFTQFPLATLIQWRDDVFSGTLPIRALATLTGVSEPAAARFAHGETLWWV